MTLSSNEMYLWKDQNGLYPTRTENWCGPEALCTVCRL